MMNEGNVIPRPSPTRSWVYIKPTPLESGLSKLADAQPSDSRPGCGLRWKRFFWVYIAVSHIDRRSVRALRALVELLRYP